jgi:uncharacterized protein (TIGR02145 family)
MMQYVSVPGLQGICPSGFFLPADADWSILQTFLGGMQVAGGKMKETGYVHWHGPNTGATNESGFTAFGSGYRHLSGYFYDFLNWAKFWSSTGYDAEWASYRELSYDNAWLTPNYYKKVSGFAVRCLKGETPSPPENRSLQNISIPDGQVNCYDATHTITVAGEGTAFAIMGGGSATMIAGQNIIYRPAVTVHPGGYLHGYITTTEQYCDTKAPSVPAAVPGENRQPATINNSFAGVYPNPTAGSFTLELSGVNQTEKVKVEIRSLPGDKVFVFTLQGGFRHGFSLSDMPAGVYIVHVVTGGRAEAFKIIKN